MKKLRILAIAIALAILLAACAGVPGTQAPGASPVEIFLPSPEATKLPSPTPLPTSTPYPTPTPFPFAYSDSVYTLAWISDTQYYSYKYPTTYYVMARFLKDQAKNLRLSYIMHTGDLVHHFASQDEWNTAFAAISMIEDIPHGMLAGNHDVNFEKADYSTFSKYFGEKYMKDKPYYGGSYLDNRGHYDLIDAGRTKYLFVYMGYAPDDAALAWLNGVFSAYPDRAGILLLHDYLKTDSTLSDAGRLIQNEVVAKNPNLYLVLCGHNYTCDNITVKFDDDGDGKKERTVYQIIANYQAAGKEGGSGYLRLIYVDEEKGKLYMKAYSPLLDDYSYYDEAAHQTEKYAADPRQEDVTLKIPWHLN